MPRRSRSNRANAQGNVTNNADNAQAEDTGENILSMLTEVQRWNSRNQIGKNLKEFNICSTCLLYCTSKSELKLHLKELKHNENVTRLKGVLKKLEDKPNRSRIDEYNLNLYKLRRGLLRELFM